MHKKLSELAVLTIPVQGRFRTKMERRWNLMGVDGFLDVTGSSYGHYCEFHEGEATVEGVHYPSVIFRDKLPFAGIHAAVLVME